MRAMRLRRLLCGTLLVLGAAPLARAADPTTQELHFWYEVNRARHDPPAWATEYGLGAQIGGDGNPVTLIGVSPRPPLALNTTLVASSRFKAQEMATYDYFGHQSQVGPTFYWPNALVRSFGYPLPFQVPSPSDPFSYYALPDGDNQVEGIACGFGPGANDYSKAINALIGLVVDSGVLSLGHRNQILGMDEFASLAVESGAGYGDSASASCINYWAFHTGVLAAPTSFLTGVAYADANANHVFDPGEGLAGVTVNAGALSTVTGNSGGWSITAPGGSYAITCSGGAFVGTGHASVDVIGYSRQVDCISGDAGAQVDFVAVPEAGSIASGLAALAILFGFAARARR